jgi:hypothetical protein
VIFIDLHELIQIAFEKSLESGNSRVKLNYRCPKGRYVPDSFSCGKTKEEAEKNIKIEKKLKKEEEKVKKEPKEVKDTKIVEVAKAIEKVKKEKASKESVSELKDVVSGMKKPSLEFSKITVTEGETYLRYQSPIKIEKITNDTVAYSFKLGGEVQSVEKPISEFKSFSDGYFSKFSEIPRIKHTNDLINDEEKKNAFARYTGGSYENINKKLLGKLTDADLPLNEREEVNSYISQMDGVMKQAAFPEETIVYSGLGKRASAFLDEMCPPKTCGEGNEFELKGFTSTSIDKKVTEMFGSGIILEIKVPVGAKALSLEPISTFPHEKEVLLNRGSKFKVMKSEMIGEGKEKHRVVSVTMVNN